MTNCTKCELIKKVESIAKNEGLHEINKELASRIVFERMLKLEAFSKAKAGEGGRFDACVKEMMNDGHSEESAKKICATIGRKKFGVKKFGKMAAVGRREANVKNCSTKKKKEANITNSLDTLPINDTDTAESSLAKYEIFFRQLQKLKLQPISNYEMLEDTQNLMRRVNEELKYAENNYKRLSMSKTIDDDLLAVRLRVRSSIIENGSGEHNVDITKNYIRKRQFDPKHCKEGTFKTFEKDGNKLVGCVNKETGKFEVQSVLEPRETSQQQENDVESDDLLYKLMDKSPEEQIQIIKEDMPEISEEIIKDMINGV